MQKAIYLRGHKGDVNHAAFCGHKNRLVSAGKDKTVKIWDYKAASEGASQNKSTTHNQHCLATLEGHTEAVTKIASHPSNEESICSVSHDGFAKLWDTRNGNASTSLNFATKERNVDVRYDPQGNHFAVLTAQNNLFIFDDRKESEPLAQKMFGSKKAPLYEIEYGPTGEYMFMTRADEIVVVEMKTLTEVATIPITCDPSKTFCLKFDRAYKYLAVASTDSIVSILSTGDWSCQRGIAHLHDAIRSVAFSHDAKWIAHAAGKLKVIDIASVKDGSQVKQVSSPEGVTSVDFAPNQYFLAITGMTSTVWVHDLRNAPELQESEMDVSE